MADVECGLEQMLSNNQVVYDEPQRKHVALLGVFLFSVQNVRGCVQRRPHIPGVSHPLHILFAEPVVSDLCHKPFCYEDVLWFQVAMHIPRSVDILQTVYHLPAHLYHQRHIQPSAAFDVLGQLTHLAKLSNYEDAFLEFELFDELYHVGVAHSPHHFNFPSEIGHLFEQCCLGELQLLDGYLASGGDLLGEEYYPEGAGSQFSDQLIFAVQYWVHNHYTARYALTLRQSQLITQYPTRLELAQKSSSGRSASHVNSSPYNLFVRSMFNLNILLGLLYTVLVIC